MNFDCIDANHIPIGLLSRAEIIRAIRLASKNSDDARNQEVLCQLTLGLGLPDHVAQEGETHADFERIFAAMDVDEDKSISFSEFLQYLTRTGVAISKLLDLKRGSVEDAGTRPAALPPQPVLQLQETPLLVEEDIRRRSDVLRRMANCPSFR